MPRVVSRQFPDASQLAIGALTVITESRIVFSGAEGLVEGLYSLVVANAAGVAVPQVTLSFNTNIVGLQGFTGVASCEAVAGRAMHMHAKFSVVNPPPGSFLEAQIATTGGTVNANANNGALLVASHDAQDLGGPVVTIAT